MSKQKAKGRYYEHRTVELLQRLGFANARRVPASGALGKLDASLADDVTFTHGGDEFRVESKMRSHGFAMLRRWLAGTGFLVVWEQRAEPIVILTEAQLAALLEAERTNEREAVLFAAAELARAPAGAGEMA